MKSIKYSILLALQVSMLPAIASADVCSEIIQNPVFTKETIKKNENTQTNFKRMLCSSSWRSASDATSAGVEATIPIFDLAIPFTANWDNTKVEQWKRKNCSAEERSGSYVTSLYKSTYEINPISAKAALECAKSMANADAVRCSISDNENAIVFNAEWRRTSGEELNSAPKIISLTYDNATCLNDADFTNDKPILDGGISLLCKRNELAPVFVLSTTRGKCIQFGTDKTNVYRLAGAMSLSAPLFVNAARVSIDDGFKLVTNGYPVQIFANENLNISGTASISSFEKAGAEKKMEPGKYAGPITIKAKRIKGGALTINNAGQNGGPGLDGQDGHTGSKGTPGVGRDPVTGKDNGLIGKVIEAIPKSCTGGKNGGKGFSGGNGTDGIPGGPGGAAGKVTLMLPLDDTDNQYISVLTGVGLDNKPRADCKEKVCGGLGGIGGKGGKKGAGGPGGDGAGGTTWCGGTDAGPKGDDGKPGANAPRGPSGATAEVSYE